MKPQVAHKEEEWTFHVGRSDPANIRVYTKKVPLSEFKRKVDPVLADINLKPKRERQ